MLIAPPSVADNQNAEPDMSTCPACCSRKPWLYKCKIMGTFKYVCTCRFATQSYEREEDARAEWEKIAKLGRETDTIIESLVDNQVEMLNKIANTVYGDYDWGKRHRDNQVICTWAEAIIEGNKDWETFTSLENAGLAWYQDNGNKRVSYVGLTSLGYLVMYRMRNLVFDWNDPNDSMLVSLDEEDIKCKKCGMAAKLTYYSPSDEYYIHCPHCLASSDKYDSKQEALEGWDNTIYLQDGDNAYSTGCHLAWDDTEKAWELISNEEDTFYDGENVNYDGVGNAYITKENKGEDKNA